MNPTWLTWVKAPSKASYAKFILLFSFMNLSWTGWCALAVPPSTNWHVQSLPVIVILSEFLLCSQYSRLYSSSYYAQYFSINWTQQSVRNFFSMQRSGSLCCINSCRSVPHGLWHTMLAKHPCRDFRFTLNIRWQKQTTMWTSTIKRFGLSTGQSTGTA